ncbi:MAG: UpxY family transcription antiterminator [Chitinophagaceae bacterium]|nr:UpxY family transcription antiterminator [Chitinophagaceae bacterium]
MHWYALYTKPRWEKKVASGLEAAGYTTYCPLNKSVRQWSDRKKVVYEPLFRGYVFIHCTLRQLWESLMIGGILAPVRYLGKPAVIRDEEIQTIKKFLKDFEDVKVEEFTLEKSARVRIRTGVLMDYEGTVVEVYGNRAIVKINSLGLQLSAQFNKKDLEKI